MIKIKINPSDKEKNPSIKTNMKLRKSLDGKLIITDHEDLDIIIDQNNKKIIVLATDMKNSDKTYYTQDLLFKNLIKKGIVDPSTVKAGNVYGCLEGKILDSNTNVNSIDLTLLALDRWLDKERPNFLYSKKQEEEFEKNLTEPDEDDSTPLGKIEHKTKKYSKEQPGGSISNTQFPY